MVLLNPVNLILLLVYPVTWNILNRLSNDNLSNLVKSLIPLVNVIVCPVIPVTNPLSIPVKPISQDVLAVKQLKSKLSGL